MLAARVKWRWARALLIASVTLCGMRHLAPAQHPLSATAIFDSDPNHIWNRTYACLFVRKSADGTEYGADTLDPLLWPRTQFLLSGDSHRRAIACLDNFLESHGERAVRDPLKRAILQHDFWAVFDWVVKSYDWEGRREWPEKDKQELETRLAEVIRRLALAPDQVRGLPDTYAAAVATHQFATDYDPRNPSCHSCLRICSAEGPYGSVSARTLTVPPLSIIFLDARDFLYSCVFPVDEMRRWNISANFALCMRVRCFPAPLTPPPH